MCDVNNILGTRADQGCTKCCELREETQSRTLLLINQSATSVSTLKISCPGFQCQGFYFVLFIQGQFKSWQKKIDIAEIGVAERRPIWRHHCHH